MKDTFTYRAKPGVETQNLYEKGKGMSVEEYALKQIDAMNKETFTKENVKKLIKMALKAAQGKATEIKDLESLESRKDDVSKLVNKVLKGKRKD